MSKEYRNFHIRMDKDLHTDLKEIAENEHRSLSAQIQLVLSEYVEHRQKNTHHANDGLNVTH